jgi:hypothetical protein
MQMKSHHHGAMTLFIALISVSRIAIAACPTDASSLQGAIKVRDSGVLAALSEPIATQIRKAGSIDRYSAAIAALRSETEQQREQWGRTARNSYGGGGDPLAWPNGCSWPASGTYCSALAVYQMSVDALAIYDFYADAATCFRSAGMQ